MKPRIIPFDDSWWPALVAFLNEHWQANHPVTQRELFFWQYKGFGPRAGVNASRIAVVGDAIVGFLGAIPGLYRLDGQQVAGSALALWVVHPDHRPKGLGIELFNAVVGESQVSVCLGVNPHVSRFYTAAGYRQLDSLHRYAVPLDPQAYPLLLKQLPENGRGDIQEWFGGLGLDDASPVEPQTIQPAELAEFWHDAGSRWRLALERTEEFWAWRYRDAVAFSYRMFGSPHGSYVIGRCEKASHPLHPELEGRAVLRIIELLPTPGDAPDSMINLLRSVLAWAHRQGGIAADFQCSSRVLEPILAAAGFRQRCEQQPLAQLPELFSPVRHDVAAINAFIRINGDANPIAFDQTYLVKSDGDMDRPTRWSL